MLCLDFLWKLIIFKPSSRRKILPSTLYQDEEREQNQKLRNPCTGCILSLSHHASGADHSVSLTIRSGCGVYSYRNYCGLDKKILYFEKIRKMRKIDRTMSEAFFDRKNLKLSNSEVRTEGVSTVLYLHGNPIIIHKDLAGNKFNTCGRDTPTTFARLN